MVPSNHSFSNNVITMLNFSLLLLVKLSSLHPIKYQFFASFFDGSLSKVIALPTIARVGRAITIREAIQNRSHETIHKTHTKIEAKRLRATTFVIANN